MPESQNHNNLLKTPHHVLIVYSSLYCSGSLISSKIVLTTASCFVKWKPPKRALVKMGTDSILGIGQIFHVVDVKVHEYYQYRGQLDNDIALVVLEKDVYFNDFVRKALVMEPQKKIKEGDYLTLSSWGKSGVKTNHENYLVVLPLKIMNNDVCHQTLGTLKTNSNFCAHYKIQPKDNGGAAIFHGYVAGILAFSGNNETTTNFAILTNTTYFYKWLSLNVKKLLTSHCADVAQPDDWYH